MTMMAFAPISVEVVASPRTDMPPSTVPLHFRVIGDSVTTNGSYTLARKAGVSTVMNETTGQQVSLVAPSSCSSPAADSVLGDSWVMTRYDASHLALYSLARRSWSFVTIAPACAHFAIGPGSACVPVAIGTDWVKFDEESVRHGDVNVFQNIRTSRLRGDPTNSTTIPDLDTPNLARRLCSPLRAPARTFASYVFEGPFALLSDESGPVLERCGTALHLVLGGAHQAGVNDHAVIWLSSPRPGPIGGIFLPSLDRFRMTPPADASNLTFVQLSSRHIYVSGLTKTSQPVTWSASLPTSIR